MTAGLMRSQWWSDARIKRYQDAKLGEILNHAARDIPHYRNLAQANKHANALSYLKQFPILRKSQLQDDITPFLDPAIDLSGLHKSRTSGSTGEPTTTYFDNRSWLLCKYALKARRVLNAGRPFGQRLLIATEESDRTTETLSHVSLARHMISTLHLAVEGSVAENIRRLLQFRPTMIYGYPSYLGHLGEAMHKTSTQPARIPILFTSSEVLTPSERDHLEGLYGGRVIDIYGSTEFKEVAVQCEAGAYHINFESVYIEPVDNDQTDHPRLLITSLVNKAMPLIRYDIGDHAAFGRGKCQCGRNGPFLVQPQGRAAEMLYFSRDVAVTPFTLTSVVGTFREIKNYTIVQESPVELRLRVYAEPRLTKERRDALISAVLSKIPADVRVSVEPLDERLPSGKRVSVARAF